MKSKIIILGSFLIVGAIIVNAGRDRRPSSYSAVASGPDAPSPAMPTPAGPVELTVLYSPEKQDWLEAVTIEFRRLEPGIKLKLQPMESLQAAEAISAGRERPTVWMPSDTASLELMRESWKRQHAEAADPVATDPELAPQPVVLSPLVFVIWRDRSDVLSDRQPLSWRTIRQVLSSPRGWAAVGGHADWGALKVGHADPTRSTAGLGALLLMADEYFGDARAVTPSAVVRPGFQAFALRIERTVPSAGVGVGDFVTDLVRFGPSRFDIGVIYESSAVAQIENAEGRWGALRVVYPSPTVWSDHPLAVLSASWVSTEQRAAARRLVMYLRSRSVQRTALAFGFRPADVGVPVVSSDLRNPFPRLTSYGVKVDLPASAPPPSPELIQRLVELGRKAQTN